MRRQLGIHCLFALILLSLLGRSWSDLSSYKSLSTSAITAFELREHVNYLASDELEGRGGGTDGARKAREYIATLFSEWKLSPLGDEGSYFQRFSFTGKISLADGNELVLTLPTGEKRSFQPGPNAEFLPLALSANGSVEGELVFAGYGIHSPDKGYDDYANLDVQGKVVLIMRGMPANDSKFNQEATFPNKMRIAREKGALALILVPNPKSGPEDRPVPFWIEPTMADAGIIGLTVKRDFAGSLFDLSSVQKMIDENLKPFSFYIPNARVKVSVNLVKEKLEDANVIGFLEGNDPKLKQEVIVIGAHYDHLGKITDKDGNLLIFNGADDNASGTSSLLELAQFFSVNRKGIKRSLMFIAFGSEERGLIGSLYFVNHPTVPFERIIAMVNLDMVGRLRDDVLYVLGLETSPDWQSLTDEVKSQFPFTIKDSPGIFGASDHYAFYNNGIPVLFFFTGIHQDYHRTSDDWEKINYEGAERVTKMACAIVERIANLPNRPKFQKVSQTQPPMRSAMKVSIGVVPDYSWEGSGVKLLGVRGGSPAEKAGLKSGDIIVEVAGKQIRNIYDYTAILSELETNKPVQVTVLRDGQRISLIVTPEPVRRQLEQ